VVIAELVSLVFTSVENLFGIVSSVIGNVFNPDEYFALIIHAIAIKKKFKND